MNRHMAQSAVILDQTPSLKAFSLAEVLSLGCSMLLPQAQARGIDALVAYVTERDAGPATTAQHSKDARTCMGEQLPFIKHVDLTPLYRAFKSGGGQERDYLQIWYDTQVRRYGNTHYLMPLSRWQRRKNSHKL